MNAPNIIPFGKYKGQPIEVLQQDKKYLEWLQNQDWFKRDYQQFNTIIINNFQEPSETPEHNKLQNLFLKDEVCRKFFELVSREFKFKQTYEIRVDEPICEAPTLKIPSLKDINNQQYFNSKKTIKTFPCDWVVSKAIFEHEGIDVKYVVDRYKDDYNGYIFTIEIKPVVSDDYPAILRQIISNKAKYLIAEYFSAKGASLEDVKEIFKRSGKSFYLFSEFI